MGADVDARRVEQGVARGIVPERPISVHLVPGDYPIAQGFVPSKALRRSARADATENFAPNLPALLFWSQLVHLVVFAGATGLGNAAMPRVFVYRQSTGR